MDRALRLIQMLRDHGSLRLRSAARELGVAESTVHRLMAMLVFHGFAIQDESRAYFPGMALGAGPARISWTKQLRELAIPHIEVLAQQSGETVNLAVRVGTTVHFLWSQEGNKVLRIVSRVGAVMPAHISAAGRILLAQLDEDKVGRLYRGAAALARGEAMDDLEFAAFLTRLRTSRRNGFATADQEIERGVVAIAVPVHDRDGRAVAALALSAPTLRDSDLMKPETVALLHEAVAGIEEDLSDVEL